jgi:hypothetical protein
MALELNPGVASLVYVFTIVGFILTIVLSIFSVTVFLQASYRKTVPRIFLHVPPQTADATQMNRMMQAKLQTQAKVSGYGGPNLYISPYDGILH